MVGRKEFCKLRSLDYIVKKDGNMRSFKEMLTCFNMVLVRLWRMVWKRTTSS